MAGRWQVQVAVKDATSRQCLERQERHGRVAVHLYNHTLSRIVMSVKVYKNLISRSQLSHYINTCSPGLL